MRHVESRSGRRDARVVAVLLAAVLVVLAAAGCSDPSGQDAAKPGKAEAPGDARVLGHLPWFSFTDQAGHRFGTDDLEGDVWVATFLFTRCPATCPKQVAALNALREEWKGAGLGEVRIVGFTVDPAYDTPKVLSAYAEKMKTDPAAWTFLTGARRDLWGLARTDFKLPVTDAASDPDVLIAHSQSFALVDGDGNIRGYYDGLDEAATALLTADAKSIVSAMAGMERPQIVMAPPEIEDPDWVDERQAAQRKAAKSYDVEYDFSFTDDLLGSGIRFRHQVVEDAGKWYKPVHYDHGNGVAVADVDGDGFADIYFATQVGSNELWRNKRDGTFEDITKRAGVGIADRIGVGCSFADVDNDGDPDLFVTSVMGGNALFQNDGNGNFTDVTAASGLAHTGHSSGTVFFDYDRDGWLDALVTEVGVYTTDEMGPDDYRIGFMDAFAGQLKPERLRPSHLYRNLGGGKFADVTQEIGIADSSWTGDATPIDLNGDGWLDVYLLNMQGHDEYYENQGGKRFVKRSREVFPKTPWGAMGVKAFDWNNDGRMDIFVTDMHTDMVDQVVGRDETGSKRPWDREKRKMVINSYPASFLNTDLNHVKGNAFYQNTGNGTFQEISGDNGAETFWPWGLSTGDLNADGYEDAFLTGSMNYPFRYAVNSILLNDAGKTFLDAEYVLGVEPRRGGRTAKPWFTLDCSTAPDSTNRHAAGRSGVLEVWGAVGSRSSVIVDLDNDGDLDIVTNEFHSAPQVFVSDLSERDGDLTYLKVDLIGARSNREGLGASVRVKTGRRMHVQVQDGKSGYLAQSSMPLYFGLDGAKRVDGIHVTWPSGTEQDVAGPIDVNQVLEIREPAGS
ncbi:FG-GAP-like repeat-containing protein [bacterium]|nr:FG-GAP-like repeat-containing protein [bacterium]